jgi:1,4-dihydroxy-2-naphthoate octaprenyltransferase
MHVSNVSVESRPGTFAQGLWRLADPKISLASLASVALGTMAAAAVGPIHFGWLAATLAAVLAIEVAKNASGEVFDFDSGTDLAVRPEDRTPFSGGKRVLVDRLLTRRQTIAIAAVGYAIGIVIGAAITKLRSPDVYWLGVAGVACAYFYHAPPFRLSYRGLGELAVAICYGPLICMGTYLVQRQRLDVVPVSLSVPLGLLVAAFLWVNEFPDYEADRAAGKNTLVVRLGRRRAAFAFCLLVGVAFAIAALLPLFRLAPIATWIGMIALIPAIAACRRVLRNPENTASIVPAQRDALLSFVVFAAGAGLGLLLA